MLVAESRRLHRHAPRTTDRWAVLPAFTRRCVGGAFCTPVRGVLRSKNTPFASSQKGANVRVSSIWGTAE